MSFEEQNIKPIRERGQGMLEYALIISLVAIVVITSLVLLGPIILRDLASALQAL